MLDISDKLQYIALLDVTQWARRYDATYSQDFLLARLAEAIETAAEAHGLDVGGLRVGGCLCNL